MSIRPELNKAVALFYSGTGAPQITAKGLDGDAQAICRLAQEQGIPLCENAPLVDLLARFEVGDEIPRELYLAVAHIIAFAYNLQGKTPEGPAATGYSVPGPQL
jgi:flagellar biosynthesis protein